MLKLITFIGTGNYEDTTYTYGERKIYTKYFPVVAASLTKPGQVFVVKTKAATDKHWDSLLSDFTQRGLIAPDSIDIPDGQSTEELWEIFDLLIDRVDDGDSVVFDITHSFRSLPVICFLSVAYLKFVKNVSIHALYYGAYEARDKEKNISPVFDLTGFCTLLDWIVGVNAFIKYGSAADLGKILEEAQSEASRKQGPARRELKKFGNLISEITNSLLTIRPFKVTERTAALNCYSEGTEQRALLDRDVKEWAVPFGALMNRVIQEYSLFAGSPDPCDPVNLDKQLEMAGWYISRGHIPQAVTIMRELLISERMRQNNVYDKVLDLHKREEITGELNGMITGGSLLGKLWSKLRELRNDIDHAGFRKSSRTSYKVINETHECYEMLKDVMGNNTVCPDQHQPPTACENEVDIENETGAVLITPLGISKGLLYSALNRIRPEYVLVVTSEKGNKLLREIFDRAEFIGSRRVIIVDDPHTGFNESARVIEKVIDYLEKIPSDNIYLNLTGGTTALQYIITKVEERLKLIKQLEITKVAFVDRRTQKEQQENPYEAGEMVVVLE